VMLSTIGTIMIFFSWVWLLIWLVTIGCWFGVATQIAFTGSFLLLLDAY
jgi:hypothetical protein